MKIDAKYYEVVSFRSFADKLQSSMMYPLLEQKTFKLSNKVCSVSKTVAQELELYGLNSSRISILVTVLMKHYFFPSRKTVQKMVHKFSMQAD
jgi:hypothetical protein